MQLYIFLDLSDAGRKKVSQNTLLNMRYQFNMENVDMVKGNQTEWELAFTPKGFQVSFYFWSFTHKRETIKPQSVDVFAAF